MDLDKIGLLKAITRRMDWLGERQRVLAENVANADTPNYKPRDLKAVSFNELVRNSQLGGTAMAASGGGSVTGGMSAGGASQAAATQPGHFRGVAGRGSDHWKAVRANGNYETAPNGNAVNLEQQMMGIAETQADHSLMSNLYRKQVGMLRKALGKPPGG